MDQPVAEGIEADLRALERIETELADVDVVLACVERQDSTRCGVCEAAIADGSMPSRAALRLCSFNSEAAPSHGTDEQLSGASAPPTIAPTELGADGGPDGTV